MDMYEIERMVNQTLWYAIMLEPYQGDKFYENDTFTVRPYSWTDYDEEEKFDGKYSHDNSWHFWHKPSGLKIQWYKYPLRGVGANIDITHEQFYAVLHDCMNSVPEAHPTNGLTFTDATFEKWWKKNEKHGKKD